MYIDVARFSAPKPSFGLWLCITHINPHRTAAP
jgi:hypothetical protein